MMRSLQVNRRRCPSRSTTKTVSHRLIYDTHTLEASSMVENSASASNGNLVTEPQTRSPLHHSLSCLMPAESLVLHLPGGIPLTEPAFI